MDESLVLDRSEVQSRELGRVSPPSSTEAIVLPRQPLLDFVPRLEAARLTLVRAPAGSGKSTLLRAWRSRLAGSVWLESSPALDDPVLLLDQLITVLRTVAPSFGESTERALFSYAEQSADRQALFRAWQRDVLRLVRPVVCFIDDYHVIDGASEGARLADDIIRYAPDTLRFVVASRGAAPSIATRMRVEGTLAEITFEDLSLRSDEIATMLRARAIEPDPELTAMVLSATNGWATGVLISANALASVESEARVDQARLIAKHPDLFAYGADELLREAPAGLIALLEVLAVIGEADDRLVTALAGDPPLLESVTGTAGIPGGESVRLARAIELGLLTREGNAVRVPSIWQGLLRERLDHRLTGDRRRSLHAALGQLLADHGRPAEALSSLFEAEAWPAAADLLARAGFDWIGEGRHRYVEALISRLPEPVRQADPRLVHLSGLCRSRGRPAEAITILEEAARLYHLAGDRQGEFDVIRMIGLLCYGQARWQQLQQVLSKAISSANLLTDRASRNGIVAAFAAKAFMASRFGLALRIANLAARGPLGLVERWSNERVRMLGYTLRGEWEQALRIGDAAFADPLIQSYPPAYHSIVPYYAMALAHHGDPERALRLITDAAMILGEENHSRLQAHAYLVESNILASLGRFDEVEASAKRALAIYESLNDATGIAPAIAVLGNLRWMVGDSHQARDYANRSIAAFEDLKVFSSDSLVWLALTAIRIIARSGDPDRARMLLDRFKRETDNPDLALVHHAELLQLGDLYDALGNEALAERTWREAWTFGAKHTITISYVPMDDALYVRAGLAGLRHGAVADYVVERLQATAPAALTAALIQLAADPAPQHRLRAMQIIERFQSASLYPTAKAALKDPDPAVRQAASTALDRIDIRPIYPLYIRSLGGFEVCRGEQAIGEREWRGAMAKRLLYRLLIAFGRPVARETIQLDLWPDAEPEAAQHNLRVALNRLNDVLEPDRPAGAPTHFIISTSETVAFNGASNYRWDAEAWLDLADRALRGPANGSSFEKQTIETNSVKIDDQFIAAFEQYGGPLLPESRDDEWLLPLRSKLADRFVSVGIRLSDSFLAAGKTASAIEIASRLTEVDPLEESGWVVLIRAQLVAGDRVGARRSYRRATQVLRAELDVDPGPELAALQSQL